MDTETVQHNMQVFMLGNRIAVAYMSVNYDIMVL